jgi:hypothetical protein
MRHSPHWKRISEASAFDESPFDGDDDEEEEDDDGIPSADEDDEQELLIAKDPHAYAAASPWSWHSTGLSAASMVIWCFVRALIAFGPRLSFPFFGTALYAATTWIFSRLMLLILRTATAGVSHLGAPSVGRPSAGAGLNWPGLRSGQCCTHVQTIGLCGAITALDLALSLWSAQRYSPSLVGLARAASPCCQLLASTLMGLTRPRLPLVAAMMTLGGGGVLAAIGFDEIASASSAPQPVRRETFEWVTFLLLLTVFGGLSAIRGGTLERMLHGRDNVGRRRHASQPPPPQPLQLMCALSPWAFLTALLVALAAEGHSALTLAGFATAATANTKSTVTGARSPTVDLLWLLPALLYMSASAFLSLWLELDIIARSSALALVVLAAVEHIVLVQPTIAASSGSLHRIDSFGVGGIVLTLIAASYYVHAATRAANKRHL